MRRLLASVLLVGFLSPAIAEDSAGFNVGITIVGPAQPPRHHPVWPNARLLHQDESRLYQAVPGDVFSARRWLLSDSTWAQARWLQDSITSVGWRAKGLLPDGQCLGVEARQVRGASVVRVQTSGCVWEHGSLK